MPLIDDVHVGGGHVNRFFKVAIETVEVTSASREAAVILYGIPAKTSLKGT